MSKVFGKKVTLNMESITHVTIYVREGSTYHDSQKVAYEEQVPRALYKEKGAEYAGTKKVVYYAMRERARIQANIINKSFRHMVGLKTTLSNHHKYFLFHLMEQLPFNLPRIVFINILMNLKTLGGRDDIFYATLVNKLLWEQGVYHVFNKMDQESKHQIIVKGLFIAKQQQCSEVNLKEMKLELQLAQREFPLVDEEAIKKIKVIEDCSRLLLMRTNPCIHLALLNVLIG